MKTKPDPGSTTSLLRNYYTARAHQENDAKLIKVPVSTSLWSWSWYLLSEGAKMWWKKSVNNNATKQKSNAAAAAVAPFLNCPWPLESAAAFKVVHCSEEQRLI